MALTLTSRFTGVGIGYDPRGMPTDIGFATTDGDNGGMDLKPWPAAGSDNLATLEILQAIWGSADGLRDADGNEVDVIINEPIFLDSNIGLAEYSARGAINPLDANSYSNYQKLNKVQGAFARHGDTSTDPDTENVSIEHGGGFVPKEIAPISGQVKISLDEWDLYIPSNALSASLTLYAKDGESYASNRFFRDDIRARAMVQWLENHRTAGAAVYAGALDSVEQSSHLLLTERQFTLVWTFGGFDYSIVCSAQLYSSNYFVSVGLTRISGSLLQRSTLGPFVFHEEVIVTTRPSNRPSQNLEITR